MSRSRRHMLIFGITLAESESALCARQTVAFGFNLAWLNVSAATQSAKDARYHRSFMLLLASDLERQHA